MPIVDALADAGDFYLEESGFYDMQRQRATQAGDGARWTILVQQGLGRITCCMIEGDVPSGLL